MLPPSKKFVALLSLLLAGASSGCASTPPARFVRAADLGKGGPLKLDQPLVIEFQEGDVVPLHFKLDGPFVKSADDAPAIPLRVVRHFYLRIDKSGFKASADGKNFDAKPVAPGAFQIGVGADKGGPMATISVRTPTPPGLEPPR